MGADRRWSASLARVVVLVLAAGVMPLAVAAPPIGALQAPALPADFDWRRVRPVSTLSVHALAAADTPLPYRGRKGLYLIEGRVVDAWSGRTLMEPRLVAVRGASSTIEVGDAVMVVFAALTVGAV